MRLGLRIMHGGVHKDIAMHPSLAIEDHTVFLVFGLWLYIQDVTYALQLPVM